MNWHDAVVVCHTSQSYIFRIIASMWKNLFISFILAGILCNVNWMENCDSCSMLTMQGSMISYRITKGKRKKVGREKERGERRRAQEWKYLLYRQICDKDKASKLNSSELYPIWIHSITEIMQFFCWKMWNFFSLFRFTVFMFSFFCWE